MENFLSFRFKKVETEEEFDKMTELMEYILEMPDADENDYTTLLWGMCQDLITEYEEKLELESEQESTKETLARLNKKVDRLIEDFDQFEKEDSIEETSVITVVETNPDKIAFRGKKKE